MPRLPADINRLFLGVGDRTVNVTLPAGPNPSTLDPGTCWLISSPSGNLVIASTNCSKADLDVNGNVTMDKGILFVPGNFTVNGSVSGNGTIIATGMIVVTGKAQLMTDDVFSFVSGGEMYLCGGTPGCAPGTGSPTPAATPTPTAAAPTSTPTPKPTASRKPTATPTATPAPKAPFIGSLPPVILVGSTFTITGADFTAGSVANFFVATSAGPVNVGPFGAVCQNAADQTHVQRPGHDYAGPGLRFRAGGEYGRERLPRLQPRLPSLLPARIGCHWVSQTISRPSTQWAAGGDQR